MLGRHTQCAWAELDRGSTQSIGAWTSFLPTPIDQRMVMVNNIRDGKTMYFAIQTTLSNIHIQIGFSTHKWMGLFRLFDVLIGVKAYIGEEACMNFDVHGDGRITFTHTKTNLFSFCLHKEVRMIANDGSNWVLDLDPQKVNSFWRIWIIERIVISRLIWDLGELYWNVRV